MKISVGRVAAISAVAVIAWLAGSSSLLAQCGGCSSMHHGRSGGAMQHDAGAQPMAGMDHGAAKATARTDAPARTLMEPVPSVLENYLKIEAALAASQLDGISGPANAAAKLAADDTMKMLPENVSVQAKALAGAKDLNAARSNFKELSASLISYLKSQNANTGQYYELYCPMAKASWLQKDQTVKNPYYGAGDMQECGKVKAAL